jgi:hypothetical protein
MHGLAKGEPPMSHASCQSLSLHRKLKLIKRIVLTLAAAAALASTAAQAAPLDESIVSGGSLSAASPGMATGRAVAVHPTVAARGPAAGMQTAVAPPIRPFDAASGLIIEGFIGFSASGATGMANISAGAVANIGTSTSGDLTLHLIASSSLPTFAGFAFFDLASADLGSLDPGTEFSGVAFDGIPYTKPPAGCYFTSLLLTSGDNVIEDFESFSSGTNTVFTNTGYALFPFNSGTCTPVTSCSRSVNGGCLLSSRFQVTAVYNNNETGSGAGQVLNFGSTRAESDESVFYFFTGPSNFELGVKILNACSLSNTFWIFIGGLTNQGWAVDVLDTQTQAKKRYTSPVNTTIVTVTDTAALPCP